MPNLEYINIGNNPYKSLLESRFAEKGNISDIQNYIISANGGLQTCSYMNLVFVGHKQGGKSSLIRSLVPLTSQDTTETRFGDNGITYRLWDLTTKEFQFFSRYFTSDNAVYIIVYDSRSTEPEITHWIESISAVSGVAPILLVGTHTDLIGQDQMQIALYSLWNKYPTQQVKGRLLLSIKDNPSVLAFKHIVDHISKDVRPNIPIEYGRFFGLINKARSDPHPVLSITQLEEMARDQTEFEDEMWTSRRIRNILKGLHFLGYVVYFDDTQNGINKIIIIKPQIILNLFNSITSSSFSNGSFREDDVLPLLREINLSSQDNSLQLMELLFRFHVLAEVRLSHTSDSERSLLVPWLLPEKPTQTEELNATSTAHTHSPLHLRLYYFDVAPSDFLVRFVTVFNKLSLTALKCSKTEISWIHSPSPGSEFQITIRTSSLSSTSTSDPSSAEVLLPSGHMDESLMITVNAKHHEDGDPFKGGRQLEELGRLLKSLSQNVDDILSEWYSNLKPRVLIVCPHCLERSQSLSSSSSSSPSSSFSSAFTLTRFDLADLRQVLTTHESFVECVRGKCWIGLNLLAPDLLVDADSKLSIPFREFDLVGRPLAENSRFTVRKGFWRGLAKPATDRHDDGNHTSNTNANANVVKTKDSLQNNASTEDEKAFVLKISKPTTTSLFGDDGKTAQSLLTRDCWLAGGTLHPCLVRVLGCCLSPSFALVCEHLQGGSLRTSLFDPLEIRDFLSQVSSANPNPSLDLHPCLKNSSVPKQFQSLLRSLVDGSLSSETKQQGVLESQAIYDDWLADQPHVPTELRLKIAFDIARGLAFLHSHVRPRILHCNLNTGNVLLVKSIPDFLSGGGGGGGQSDRISRLPENGHSGGVHARDLEWWMTPLAKLGDFSAGSHGLFPRESINATEPARKAWFAPETLLRHEFRAASDVYAMGFIFYELWTRKEVADPDTDAPPEEIIRGKRPRLSEDTPDWFSALVRQCWEVDLAKRPSAENAALTISSGISRYISARHDWWDNLNSVHEQTPLFINNDFSTFLSGTKTKSNYKLATRHQLSISSKKVRVLSGAALEEGLLLMGLDDGNVAAWDGLHSKTLLAVTPAHALSVESMAFFNHSGIYPTVEVAANSRVVEKLVLTGCSVELGLWRLKCEVVGASEATARGYLVLKKWLSSKRYWCVLEKRRLSWYKSHDTKTPKGYVDLKKANKVLLREQPAKQKNLPAVGFIIGYGSKQSLLIAPDQEQHKMWLNALSLLTKPETIVFSMTNICRVPCQPILSSVLPLEYPWYEIWSGSSQDPTINVWQIYEKPPYLRNVRSLSLASDSQFGSVNHNPNVVGGSIGSGGGGGVMAMVMSASHDSVWVSSRSCVGVVDLRQHKVHDFRHETDSPVTCLISVSKGLASEIWGGCLNGSLYIYNSTTREALRVFRDQEQKRIYSLLECGPYIWSCGAGGHINLWSKLTHDRQTSLKKLHEDVVSRLFTSDQQVWCTSWDSTISVWEPEGYKANERNSDEGEDDDDGASGGLLF
eukprot:TRINITY_DN3495_c0_g1_i1.p1 TRINITY_DN3495_c0_g1~~TRINITY_DN3495_c0_g1_i1.p1  ORF type:complete len:1705 (-),score=316.09 TRINITY_DN3495_c0_g1_i1:36-4598(-)